MISIRSRLISLFTIQIVIILAAGGIYLDWRLRQTLENELASKLEGLAKSIAMQIDGDLVQNIFPGDEETRTFRNLYSQLRDFTKQIKVRRVYIFSGSQKNLVDTKPDSRIGSEVIFLPLTDEEKVELFSGKTLSSTLFTGSDGRLYKTGFAPIFSQEQVVAALALEASADTLEAIEIVRRDLIILAATVLVGSVFVGLFFSQRLTVPINRLKAAAQKITKGDYESQIADSTRDEIGFLAQTMEEMRRAIIQRDTRQKAMLASVAHEIRNPLGGIELFAGLLVSDLKDENAKNQARKIQKEVQNLKKIVSDFLDYAKPSQPRKELCVVRDIFAEAKSLLANELHSHEIIFKDENRGTRINFDPQHLKQIFLNLMKNSIEALSGSGKILLKVNRIKGLVKISFSDSGPGIPPENQSQVFEPFFTGRKQGTGLGLAIVKSLVEENGGQIRLVTDKPTGTTFEISLREKPQ